MTLEDILKGQDLSPELTCKMLLEEDKINGGPITQIIIDAWRDNKGDSELESVEMLEAIDQDLMYAVSELVKARTNVLRRTCELKFEQEMLKQIKQ